MNTVQFTCDMCGEFHNKLLPTSTDLTACHRCGNLINISSLQVRNRRRKNNIFQNISNGNRDNFDDYADEINDEELNPELDDDFYNFDRYESHEDYLPSPNQINPRFNRNGNNRRSMDLGNNNRPFVRNRSTNINNNNRKRNSSSDMFPIQIANDNYDRISAFHRRSNFGFPQGNNRRNNNFNLYRDIDNILEDFDFDDELNADLELHSLMDSNNINNQVGLLANLINPPPKPKLKLKKIKMCKALYTKNDSGKIEKPTCCICLGLMKIRDDIVLLKCQHLFHFKCLEKWIETKEACPFCRGKIEFGNIIKKDKKEDKKEEKKENKKLIMNEDKKVEEIKDKKTKDIKPTIRKDKTKSINDNFFLNKSKMKSKK